MFRSRRIVRKITITHSQGVVSEKEGYMSATAVLLQLQQHYGSYSQLQTQIVSYSRSTSATAAVRQLQS